MVLKLIAEEDVLGTVYFVCNEMTSLSLQMNKRPGTGVRIGSGY
jgi:hypothetical protein